MRRRPIDEPYVGLTRYQGLGYRQDATDLWRVVDKSTGNSVGPHYRSKAELLADLDRYATEFGACLRA